MGGFRAVLRHADLRRVFAALILSSTGSWAYNVALLVFVYQRTGSTGWVRAAALARFLPQLLASAYAGVIAERIERVRLMVRCDLAAMACQVGLAVVAAAHGPVVLALVFTALTSLFVAPYEPAAAALLPQIASEDELVAANALRGTIDNLVVIAGPGIGAVLLALAPPAGVFAINAA